MIKLRLVESADRAHGGPAQILLDTVLGGRRQVRLGELIEVLDLPGFVAVDTADRNRIVGLATWSAERAELASMAVAADVRRSGVGTMLVDAVSDAARRVGLDRLWLSTTNDNLAALGLYQRCGFRIIKVVVDGVDRGRELKPSIPLLGAHGIPIHDELVLERVLD